MPRFAALVIMTVLLHGTADGQTPSVRTGSPVTAGPVLRHNPVFGLGPQTIWKGGIGVALEGELTRAASAVEARERALHVELLYGVTQDLTLTLALPLVQRKTERGLIPGVGQVDRDATGIGDGVVRAKWRFFHKFSGPTQYHAAFIGGVKLPLARTGSDPPLGSGSTDFLGGVTISRDGLRYYLWTSALVRANGEAFGRKRGNEYRYDAAVGFRPWVPKYTGVDPLLLVELNGVTATRTVVDVVEQSQTGGTIMAVSPGFWLTLRNWALQGAIKLPVYQNLRGDQPQFDYTVVLKLETHM
ncbi:MAG: hypothetical protein ACE5JR_10490 [Gemmatimonadota bacterium]